MKLFDVIKLLVDLPAEGLLKGAQGAIVDLHGDPAEAYEVEFIDKEGKTIALMTLRFDQIALVPPASP